MESRVYFRNLNALRFFAATAVIFHHVEQYKFWAKIPSIWGDATIDALGQKAVSFFFVLSGFLITYLLLEEDRKTDSIHIREFYIRRVLRIWPVYYLVIVLCLFVVPNAIDTGLLGIDIHDGKFTLRVILLFLVLPNVMRVITPNIIGGNQLWSIGVEEQFYLVWPLFVKFFKRRFLFFLILFIALKLIITVGLDVWQRAAADLTSSAVFRFWNLLKIEQMAVGAIGAWMVFSNRSKWLAMVFHPVVIATCGLGLVALFVVPDHHWLVNYVEAIVFLVLILNISLNPRFPAALETRLLNKLGNVSYGIYMFHTLCITACLYTLTAFGIEKQNLLVFNVALYISSVALTIAVALVSFEFFESRFLALKERFMVVKSGTTQK